MLFKADCRVQFSLLLCNFIDADKPSGHSSTEANLHLSCGLLIGLYPIFMINTLPIALIRLFEKISIVTSV